MYGILSSEESLPAPAIGRSIQRVIVLDTETTGLLPYDRIITLAAIRFEGTERRDHIYRVYDPRKDSHPGAFAVHGWDDWTLRFQALFADDADEIHEWLSWADRLVMHNASFDMRYVERELRKAEAPQLAVSTHCTMLQARETWNGSAKLDDCLGRIGVRRQSHTHGALEDALLTANLYFHLQGASVRHEWVGDLPGPTNLRAAPSRPAGRLPRRETKKRRPKGSAVDALPSPGDFNTDLIAACEGTRDGLLILRHLAEVGQVNIEAQIDVLDGYIGQVLGDLGIEASSKLVRSLYGFALGMSGSREDALDAAVRLAPHSDAIVLLGPIMLNMIKVDGAASEEESRAAKTIIAAIREARRID